MNQHPGIFGKKLGMTQIFLEDGSVMPCTVVQAGCVVVGKRTDEKDGYNAIVLGLGEAKPKHTSKAVATAFEKAGVKAPKHIRELRASAATVAGCEIGQVLKLEEIFEEGQLVDVQAHSRGKGFAGDMKRHNFKGLNMTHGTHEWRRHGGSIGTNMTPGRTKPGQKMEGQMGNKVVTVLSQKVARIVPDKQLLLIAGSVPGAPDALVRVQGAVKKRGGKKKKPA